MQKIAISYALERNYAVPGRTMETGTLIRVSS